MGYLAAFQWFGYEYILRDELDEIRQQFDYPHVRQTVYLDKVRYDLQPDQDLLVATRSGQPFVFGGDLQGGAPLQVIFRRCQMYLPGGHWRLNTAVRHLENLIPKTT